jgi:hypothetical protein
MIVVHVRTMKIYVIVLEKFKKKIHGVKIV